jgi:hypothetical protein
MTNFLDDMAVWLASSSTGNGQWGPGVSSSMPVYKTQMPASTGNFYVLYAYAGMAPDRLYGSYIDRPRFQVMTLTNSTVDGGYAAAKLAGNRFRYVANMWLPASSAGNFYIEVAPLAEPESMGLDQNKRMQWFQNFQVQFSY